MNLGLWLEDYRLACQASGVDNDDFIIRNLPLFKSNGSLALLREADPSGLLSARRIDMFFAPTHVVARLVGT